MWSILGEQSAAVVVEGNVYSTYSGDDIRRVETLFPKATIYHEGKFK
jgi:hypothetical protein